MHLGVTKVFKNLCFDLYQDKILDVIRTNEFTLNLFDESHISEKVEFRDDEACGPGNALPINEISNLIKIAKIQKRDIFYDLGSGYGRVVREVAKRTPAKKSNGIESNVTRFCKSITITKKEIAQKKMKRSEYERVEFWFSEYRDFDFSDATVVYNGLPETDDTEINLYNNLFKNLTIKIITTELPLIGYRPIQSKTYRNTNFFLMKTPLSKYKIRDSDDWARYVILGMANPTIKDVYNYYYDLLKKRGFRGEKLEQFITDLKRLVKKRLY